MLDLKLKKYGSTEYHVNNERILMRMGRINIVYRVEKIVEISRTPNGKRGCENDRTYSREERITCITILCKRMASYELGGTARCQTLINAIKDMKFWKPCFTHFLKGHRRR